MKFISNILIRTSARRSILMGFLSLMLLINFVNTSFAKEIADSRLSDIALVGTFYKQVGDSMFWFSEGKNAGGLRRQLIASLAACEAQGLDPQQYRIEELKNLNTGSSTTTTQRDADHLFTDVALEYMKDLVKGNLSSNFVSYDELSSKALPKDKQLLVDLLAGCADSASLEKTLNSLEPATAEYQLLKTALSNTLNTDTARQLKTALNAYRWIHHFQFAKCIVVNIPSARLYYYEGDSLKLEMKVVLGKPATPTPKFAAHCNEVILYPYWNVPHSIAVNEFLPMCKKGYGVLKLMNIQVLNSKGQVVNPATINWSAYNKKNFPFRFRQSTGCDNALGVIKLNLTSPYSVYLHDTNMKFAFKLNKRFQSHGCIRIEKPVELCRFLLDGVFDQTLVDACVKDQKPVTKKLSGPVPIFVIYATADSRGQSLKYYPDIYKLNRKP
jgi:L,D-transpeptidase YcbB